MMLSRKVFLFLMMASLVGAAAAESLQSLMPNPVPAGTASFALNVSGAGFQYGDTAYLDGSSRPTIVESDSFVRVLIYAADVAKAGKHTIVVKSPSGATSNSLPFTVSGSGSTPPPTKKVTVTIASPAAGAVTCSPVTLSASAVTTNSGATIARWQIVSNTGTVLWTSSAAAGSIRPALKLAAGAHTVEVEAWDSANLEGTASVSFTVSTASPPCGTGGTGGGSGGTGSGPVASWHACMRNSGGHDYQAMVVTMDGGGSLPFNATLYTGTGCKDANWLDQIGFGTPVSLGGFSYTFWFIHHPDLPNSSVVWTIGNQSSGCVNYNTVPQC